MSTAILHLRALVSHTKPSGIAHQLPLAKIRTKHMNLNIDELTRVFLGKKIHQSELIKVRCLEENKSKVLRCSYAKQSKKHLQK